MSRDTRVWLVCGKPGEYPWKVAPRLQVFAIKGEDVIRGRFLMPEHVAMMAQFSNICALEDEILRQAGISGGVE